MSLESGRKLGITASLIAVIAPVIGVIAYVLLILSLVVSIPFGTNPTTPTLSTFPVFIIVFIAAIGILALIGFVLFIVAMHRLSEYYNDPSIFKNTLYGFIINIIGTISFVIIYIALLGSLIGSIAQSSTQTTAATPTPTVPPILNSFGLFISSFLVLIGIAIVLGIVSAIFYMRAFNKLGEKSGIDNFKTAGLLYLLGVVLSIVGVGVFLVWVAWILALIGFRSLKPFSTTPFAYSPPTPPPKTSDMAQKRYCPYCGTENNPGSLYCRSCGKQLQ
jgi:uncharacterized membrane protein